MQCLTGIPASEGFARGPLHILDQAPPADPGGADARRGDAHKQSRRLRGALNRATAQLVDLQRASPHSEAQAILEFQVAMLADETLSSPAFAHIRAGATAGAAWRAVMDAQIHDYSAADDEYFRARAADLRDIRDRVLHGLAGFTRAEVPGGSIVVARDLLPSRFLEIRWAGGGVALYEGSTTSHVATLARGRGVPMIVRMSAAILDTHDVGILDAGEGVLVASPDAARLRVFERREAAAAARDVVDRTFLTSEAFATNGDRVRVQLNVADGSELAGLDPAACDGIGLVRTEFLLRTLSDVRDEQWQFDRYAEIVAWAAGRPVTFRTLDAGADKPIEGYPEAAEPSGLRGVRGVRLSLLHPEIFATQLRALVRVAALGPVRILIPMVTQPAELTEVRRLLTAVREELRAAGRPCGDPEVGMMVEVPAAALTLDLFDADFFSIGSNDLIAFLTASGRDATRLSALSDPLAPAVLRVIAHVVDQARRRNTDVSLCGDMASDERCLAALWQSGLRAISVAPAALARVKAALAGIGEPRVG